jgi:hypothetical protein
MLDSFRNRDNKFFLHFIIFNGSKNLSFHKFFSGANNTKEHILAVYKVCVSFRGDEEAQGD